MQTTTAVSVGGRNQVAPSPLAQDTYGEGDCEEPRAPRLTGPDPQLVSHDEPKHQQLCRALRSFRNRLHSDGVKRRALWALLMMLRNAYVSVSVAWLLTFLCSLGTLFSSPVAQQSYNRFLTATLVWCHFFFCLCIFLVQACFLTRRRFLSNPDTAPTFLFCLQRLYSQTYYPYFISLVLLLGSTLLISKCTPVQMRRYKLEFYIGCLCSHVYTTHAVISTWRIIQHETIHRVNGSGSRPTAASRRGGYLARLRHFGFVFLVYSPLAVTVVLAGLFVHLISKYRISSQTEMLTVSAVSLAFKLLIQESIKMYVIRRNVKDIRTMCVAVGLPTVLIDTQLRIALQRVESAHLTITGTVLLAIVEIAMRSGKVLLVTLEIRREERKVRLQTVARRLHQVQEQPVDPLKEQPPLPPLTRRSPRQRRSSLTTPDARFQRWKKKLLAFHTAEIYADMSAEYIAIGCSAALLYFFWSHPKYKLRLLDAPSSSLSPRPSSETQSKNAMPANQLLLLGLQVGAEMGVDYVASLLEMSAGIDFMELRKFGPFVACVFVSITVINILISAVIFMRV